MLKILSHKVKYLLILLLICCSFFVFYSAISHQESQGIAGKTVIIPLTFSTSSSRKTVSLETLEHGAVPLNTQRLDTLAATEPPQSRFLLVVFPSEQLHAQTNSYLDTCRIARDWNASLIEPFICGTRLFGLKHFVSEYCPKSESVVSYGTIFDLSRLEEVLEYNNCELKSWGQFERHSYRKIFLIIITVKARGEQKPGLTLCNDDNYTLLSTLISTLNSNLPKTYPAFEGAGVVCVSLNYSTHTTTSNLSFFMNSYLPKNKRDSFSVFILHYNFRIRNGFIQSSNSMRFSQKYFPVISKKLDPFVDMFLGSLSLKEDNYLSVHVRIEKLLRSHVRKNITCCMEKLRSALLGLGDEAADGQSRKILFITDISKYGTQSCVNNCANKSRATLRGFSNVIGQEPNFFDASNFYRYFPFNSAAVSAIEQEALSKGKWLIVVGGGTFQYSLKSRFTQIKENHNSLGKQAVEICQAKEAYEC